MPKGEGKAQTFPRIRSPSALKHKKRNRGEAEEMTPLAEERKVISLYPIIVISPLAEIIPPPWAFDRLSDALGENRGTTTELPR